MRHFFPLLLLFFPGVGISQTKGNAYAEEKKIIEQVLKKKETPGNKIRKIDSLLFLEKITVPDLAGLLFRKKAELLYQRNAERLLEISETWNLENEHRAEGDTSGNFLFIPIATALQSAINACGDCRLRFTVDRYEYLEHIKIDAQQEQRDLDTLKMHGYKKDFHSGFISVNAGQSVHSWYGLEIALAGNVSPLYKLFQAGPDGKKKILLRNTPTVGLAAVLGGEFRDAKNYSFHFSFARLQSPLLLSLTTIGFLKTEEKEKLKFFYRPEAGFGWGWFSVSYAYNFIFKRAERPFADKNFLIFRLLMPFRKPKN